MFTKHRSHPFEDLVAGIKFRQDMIQFVTPLDLIDIPIHTHTCVAASIAKLAKFGQSNPQEGVTAADTAHKPG